MAETTTEGTKKMTVQDVLDGIVEMIRNGTYLPGDPIREVEICRLFGVSRTPVREAFRLLQDSGVVEYIPRCGVQVAAMKRETLDNITETRMVLEVLSARQAAERITQEEIEELRQLNERFLIAPTDRKGGDLDKTFHIKIAKISGNDCVVKFLDNLQMRQSIFSSSFEEKPARRRYSYAEHLGILQAMELHDPELAAKQTDIHFHMSQASLQNRLETYFEKHSK